MGIIKTEEGLINLIGAIMEQARKDAESSDESLAKEAKEYIKMMEEAFS